MTTPHGVPGTDAGGSEPTQPFWTGPDPTAADPAGKQPAGAAGPGPAAGPPPYPGGRLGRDRRRARHWTLGLVVAAVLAVGGAVAAVLLAGHSSPNAALSQTSPAAAGQGALLNSALSNAGSPGALVTTMSAPGTQAGASAPGTTAPLCPRARRVAREAKRAGLPRLARRIQIGAARCGLARRRVFRFFLLRGVQGQFTIQTRKGTRTLAFERGVIQSVQAGKSVVVKASDGTTWTWDLVSTTVVRDQQGKVSESSLTAGTPVWVGGPVVQGVKDARLIVLRPPQPAEALPSPAPSG